MPRDPRCRACHAPVHWCTSAASRKRIPIDTSPDPHGNIRKIVTGAANTRETIARRLAGDELTAAIVDRELLFTDHRDTCSAARPRNPRPAA